MCLPYKTYQFDIVWIICLLSIRHMRVSLTYNELSFRYQGQYGTAQKLGQFFFFFLRLFLSWKQRTCFGQSLIHVLEQITMPHLSANRDDICVTSIKHAHATPARGTHRLEEFRHWGAKPTGQTAAAAGTEDHALSQNSCQSCYSWRKGILLQKRDVSAKLVSRLSLLI